MSAELRALAERATACRDWRWLPGALCLNGVRVLGVRALNDGTERVQTTNGRQVNLLPDLADPATLGCLLALVREAWGDSSIGAEAHENGAALLWFAKSNISGPACGAGPTECHALVDALEAAPLASGPGGAS